MSAILSEPITSAREQTDALFDIIHPDAIYDRPIPERHRLIFYLGHLEAFDWNQIGRGVLGMSSFHPEFDKLFESGIDPEPGKAPHDQPADWPSVKELLAYNNEARRRVDAVLGSAPEWMVTVVLEHRMMHAETLAYLMHALPFEKKARLQQPAVPGPAVSPSMVDIPGGSVTLGQRADQFGWDNEFAQHTVDVQPFRISKYKITNGEYLEFVKQGAPAPHFWVVENGKHYYRGMFECMPLPLDWPVYVTHDEARIYAEWAGKTLPTEPQFHRAAFGTNTQQERAYPWDDRGRDSAPTPARGNFDFSRWDPVPVAATPAGDSAFGVAQLVGNGWEWTSTEFSPFPGFQSLPFYPGYSSNFFDGRHYVLKGGSPRTAAVLLRRSFRNWFRPNYPYLYATFRLVENG